MSAELRKYPRTPHLEGSRLQPGDEDLDQIPFSRIRGRHLVVEEKIDGANSAISFGPDGDLRLQSRGHYLTGGERERHFALFKTWAGVHQGALREVLGHRYLLYGEWAFAKHTLFYDLLPHYFLEFDVLDRLEGCFLSTPRRQALLAGLPLVSVPVLAQGPFTRLEALVGLVGPARWKSPDWREVLASAAEEVGIPAELARRQTDPSGLAEGLYLKIEEEGRVVVRLKYVRADFLTAVLDSGSHWLTRTILPNRLAPGVDLYGASR